jgi:hypothetical protein
MIEQRSLLKLVSDRPPAPSDRPPVVPMLAIQRGMPDVRKHRLALRGRRGHGPWLPPMVPGWSTWPTTRCW